MLAQDGALLLKGIIIMPHQCSRAAGCLVPVGIRVPCSVSNSSSWRGCGRPSQV